MEASPFLSYTNETTQHTLERFKIQANVQENSRRAKSGATSLHKLLGSWNQPRAWGLGLSVEPLGRSLGPGRRRRHNTSINTTQSASPVVRRAQLPSGLPSSIPSVSSKGVSARPRSGRGPKGCASGIAHRHARGALRSPEPLRREPA